MAKRPSSSDFFKQFDLDFEVRDLKPDIAVQLRRMAAMDHDDFVRAMSRTFDQVSIDVVALLYADAVESPGSKTNLNMLIKLICRLIGVRHLFEMCIREHDDMFDSTSLDINEIRIELLRRIDEFRRTGE